MTERIMTNATVLRGWRKSSYSNSEGGSCLEVADGYPSGMPVRDSKVPYGPALVFPPSSWSTFITAVKHHELPA